MVKNSLSKTGGFNKQLAKVFTPIWLMVYVGIIILVGSAWVWWHFVYNNSDRVFWDMVGSNLQTQSFTQRSVQDDGQQKVEQVTTVRTAPKQLVNSRTDMTQLTPPTASVVTESIGTPATDYVRYTYVSTSQKNTSGKAIDFSSILNKWGKTATADTTSTNGQLFGQSVLSAIPFGSLTASQRRQLVTYMRDHKVYTPLLSKTERQAGRTTYLYKVNIDMVAYITALKEFASDLGLSQLAQVDPSQYQSQGPVSVDVQIDGMSHRLTQVSYNNGSRVEKFSAYGLRSSLQEPPKDTISVEELQYKLQSIQ